MSGVPAPPSRLASHRAGAATRAVTLVLAACAPDAPDCAPGPPTLGTVPFGDDGAATDVWRDLSDGDSLLLEAGGQGGVHVWASVALACAPAQPEGAFWLTDTTGAVVAGSPTFVAPLPVIMRCAADGADLRCTGQQVVFVVPNPPVDDPAWFGPPFTLHFAGDDTVSVAVRLVDTR